MLAFFYRQSVYSTPVGSLHFPRFIDEIINLREKRHLPWDKQLKYLFIWLHYLLISS